MSAFQLIGDLFHNVFFAPVVNLLVLLVHGLNFLHIPGALGLAIVLLTVIIRLAVWPFMSSQIKSAKKMAELKPKLDELKLKHKGDKQAISKAQMELYKEHGVNPAGGCVPALVQLPVIIALYQAIMGFFNGSAGLDSLNSTLYPFIVKFDKAPDPHFLFFDLTKKPADFGTIGIFVLTIPVITALLQFVQSKMMTPAPVKAYPSDSPKEKKEKGSTDEAIGALQLLIVYLLPLMIGYFAFTFPIGLALYWNTFSVLGIIQQYLLSGWGGLAGWVNKLGVGSRTVD
ncbi:YidC/Oxa1 family membrane protein insertase [Candidatus Daviesbacteria bacterium]|nr:YidC/Oxa1 family membrane protein insertase [Candidatus Daviesbacteria bacterium]